MKVKLECRDAEHICDKNQYKEAGFWEKMRLTLHMAYCSACRKYTLRNTKLTKAIQSPQVQTVSQSEKEALKKKLEQQLSQQ
mmetsp:Transcript_14572/g.21895  ORF Transcript_14572/g.21895 Transcript_14572/m.21895 type:complete len:82 (-) Transcript_14572:131-376(-)